MWELISQETIETHINRKKCDWIGHTLTTTQKINHKAGFNMEPQGKRKRQRPIITWRRIAEHAENAEGLSWQQVERKAQDLRGWRGFINGLCSILNLKSWVSKSLGIVDGVSWVTIRILRNIEKVSGVIKVPRMGRPVAQLVEQVPHIQKLCPRCSGNRVDFTCGPLLHVIPSLSFPCFLSTLQVSYQRNKGRKSPKYKSPKDIIGMYRVVPCECFRIFEAVSSV